MGKKKKKEVTAPSDFSDEVYTFYPPRENLSPEEIESLPAHISEWDSRLDAQKVVLPLMCKKDLFNDKKNTVYLIEAFLIAHEAGLYPPLWVLNHLEEIFRQYYKSFGKKSLDKLLNVSRGKGINTAFKEVFNHYRDEILMIDVFILRTLFGYSIEKASLLVAQRLREQKEWNKTDLKLKTLKPNAIAFKYKKEWSKVLDNTSNKERLQQWSEEQKKEFLNRFPKVIYDDE